MIQRFKALPKKHKVLIGCCSLILLVGGIANVELRKTAPALRYVLAQATRGTVSVTVTGSGQVSGQSQIDVKPTVSGSITKVLAQPGALVAANDPLFELDKKDALKTIRDATQSVNDARLSLASSELSLRKLQQGADPVALTQAQNAVDQAQRAVDKIKNGPDPIDLREAQAEVATQEENTRISNDRVTPQSVRTAYDGAVPVLRTTLQSLQQSLYDADLVLGLDNVTANAAIKPVLSVLDTSKLAQANNGYGQVKRTTAMLKTHIEALKTTGEDPAKIDAALQEARAALDLSGPFLQNMYDVLLSTLTNSTFSQANLDTLRSTVQADRSTIASRSSTILSQITTLQQAQTTYVNAQANLDRARLVLDKLVHPDPDALLSAQERLAEAQKSLEKLKRGADPIDVAVSQNGVAQRRSSLAAAQAHLADVQETLNAYTVRAPFAGVVARVSVKDADSASPSTALGTLLTQDKVAQVSLNEVDVAKVKVGQKATLTFDALPDLTMAGVVSEVDSLGTATQGVVNYAVKISFATQDDRIKSSMSVSATIVTDVRVDVLTIPNGAIRNGSVQVATMVPTSTVLTADGIELAAPPVTKAIQTGISNDQSTEILGGLTENEYVATRTIDPSTATPAKTAATSGSSAIRIPGVTGGSTGFGGGTRAAIGR